MRAGTPYITMQPQRNATQAAEVGMNSTCFWSVLPASVPFPCLSSARGSLVGAEAEAWGEKWLLKTIEKGEEN